jgi:transcriptional regulator with XRE-family HTH domain
MPLAKNLKRLRKSKSLTRAQLATATDLSRDNIRRLEDGLTTDPRLTTLEALASGLGTTLQELLA